MPLQGFIFDVLQDYDVIKATEYWTATNVSDGLQALCTCVEMVIFSAIFVWAFSWKQYKTLRPVAGGKPTSFWRATLHSLNYSDLVVEAWFGLVFLWNFIRRKPGTRASQSGMNIEAAFSGERDWKEANGPIQIDSPNVGRDTASWQRPASDFYGGAGAGAGQAGGVAHQAYPMEERVGPYGQQGQQAYGSYRQEERSDAGYAREEEQARGYGHGAYLSEDGEYYESRGQEDFYPPGQEQQYRQQQQQQQHGSYYGNAQ